MARRSTPRSPARIGAPVLPVVLAMGLALSSCSLLSDDDGTIPALPPTTIVAARPVDVATLRTLLPTAADIGPGFVEVSTTDDAWDTPVASPAEGGTATNDGTATVAEEGDDFGTLLDRALQESCPGAARFLLGESYGGPSSSGRGSGVGTEREYEAPDGRAFAVSVSSGSADQPTASDLEALDAMIEQVDACPTMRIDDVGDGMSAGITLDAERDHRVGEWGLIMSMRMAMTHPNLAAPLVARVEVAVFGVGSVTVVLMATDGVGQGTVDITPGAFDRITALAPVLELTAAAAQM